MKGDGGAVVMGCCDLAPGLGVILSPAMADMSAGHQEEVTRTCHQINNQVWPVPPASHHSLQ